MDGAVWGFIGVLVGGIVTGWFTIRAESLRADKEAALDRDKRKDDRRLGRDNFRRETLLALQEAASVVNAVLLHYQLRHAGIAAPADTVEKYRIATWQLVMLRSRTDDPGLRTAAGAMLEAAQDTSSAATANASEAGLVRAAEAARLIYDRCGELILATFVEPDPKK